jgi:hypothetical protein
LNSAELRQAWILSMLSNELIATRRAGGAPSSDVTVLAACKNAPAAGSNESLRFGSVVLEIDVHIPDTVPASVYISSFETAARSLKVEVRSTAGVEILPLAQAIWFIPK